MGQKSSHMRKKSLSDRSASSSRQRFDRPHPSERDTRGRTTGGRRPNRNERHAWGSEIHIRRPADELAFNGIELRLTSARRSCRSAKL
jgi:hypothetical protein